LPNEELLARRGEVSIAAQRERGDERDLESREGRIELLEDHLYAAATRRERLETAPRRQRRAELPRAEEIEAAAREKLATLGAEAQLAGPPSVEARQEAAAIEAVLAERCQLAITAARLAPPAYIKSELGERPSDPTKRKSWERGVEGIERYRQEHGISDRERAFGAEPKGRSERASWNTQRRRLAEQQRQLGLARGARSRGLQRGASMEIGI
jgi:hypothetical protein